MECIVYSLNRKVDEQLQIETNLGLQVWIALKSQMNLYINCMPFIVYGRLINRLCSSNKTSMFTQSNGAQFFLFCSYAFCLCQVIFLRATRLMNVRVYAYSGVTTCNVNFDFVSPENIERINKLAYGAHLLAMCVCVGHSRENLDLRINLGIINLNMDIFPS